MDHSNMHMAKFTWIFGNEFNTPQGELKVDKLVKLWALQNKNSQALGLTKQKI